MSGLSPLASHELFAEGAGVTAATTTAVLEALRCGCDPRTGEVLAPTEIVRRADVMRAIREAVVATKWMELAVQTAERMRTRPDARFESRQAAQRGDEFRGLRMRDVHAACKRAYPNHIAFIQNGFFWEVYESDALSCADLFGWRIAAKGSLTMTGVPCGARSFIARLRHDRIPHLFVEQSPRRSASDAVVRIITSVWPESR